MPKSLSSKAQTVCMKLMRQAGLALLFLALIGLPLFLHLGELPVQVWDEARVGVNAQEFGQASSWLVPTFEGEPDMWSTKPPLMVWLVYGFNQLLGPGEWALRLPSALAGLLTCLVLVYIGGKVLGNKFIGALAAMVLVTATGYVKIHGTRTGDYDALLTLFITLYSFSWYLWLTRFKARYILFTFLFLSLAALTKSVAAFFPVPALLLFTVAQKQLRWSLRKPQLYMGLLFFVLLVGGYYLGREQVNPGYLAKIWTDELAHSYTNTVQGHSNSVFYYIGLWFSRSFMPWMLLVPAAIYLCYTAGGAQRRLMLFCLTYIGVLLFIISTAATKLNWYDLSFYPFAALILAMGLRRLGVILWEALEFLPYRNIVLVSLLALVFYMPYYTVLDNAWFNTDDLRRHPYWHLSHYLQQVNRHKPDYIDSELYYLYPDYHAHLLFYDNLLAQKGIQCQRTWPGQIKNGSLLVVQDAELKRFVEANLDTQLIDARESVNVYHIY